MQLCVVEYVSQCDSQRDSR